MLWLASKVRFRVWPRASVTLVTPPSTLCSYFVACYSGSVTVVVPAADGSVFEYA